MKLQFKYFLFVALLSCVFFSYGVNARCTTMSGVTLCDNGDIEIERNDGIYTLVDDELYFEEYYYAYHGHDYGYDYGYCADPYVDPFRYTGGCLYGDCGYSEIYKD